MTECIIRFEYCNTNAPDKLYKVNAIELIINNLNKTKSSLSSCNDDDEDDNASSSF